MSCRRILATTPDLPKPAAAVLEKARQAPLTRAMHEQLTAFIPAFEAIELLAAPSVRAAPESLRVAAWNAERLKYAEPSAALVHARDPDVLLLTETDVGMARSGNRHTTADLAAELGMGYAYGVEFVELGIGDDREQRWHAGETNDIGFHGNAILSRLPLRDFALIRLDEGAAWWLDARDDQRRLGWRMALCARVDSADGPVFLVCVHLENKSDAADRAAQVRHLLEEVEILALGNPTIIGGDFNTSALPGQKTGASWTRAPEEDEPLFAELASASFEWQLCNTDEITMRMRPDGTPVPPFCRIDWFFTKGLKADGAVTCPAVDASGAAISDHDLIAVEVRAG